MSDPVPVGTLLTRGASLPRPAGAGGLTSVAPAPAPARGAKRSAHVIGNKCAGCAVMGFSVYLLLRALFVPTGTKRTVLVFGGFGV